MRSGDVDGGEHRAEILTDQCQFRNPAILVCRLGIVGVTADGELVLDDHRQHAARRESQAELHVHRVVEVLTETADSLDARAAPERRCLWHIPVVAHPEGTRTLRERRHPDGVERAVGMQIATGPNDPVSGGFG